MTQILLVEDDVKLARFIELELASEGYQVRVTYDGIAGLTALRESPPDLVIMDWGLPGVSGLEICRRLRATGNQLPIILLTARDEVTDRVTGLDAGADDYLSKPFSIEELLARIRVRLRSTQHRDELCFEEVRLNRQTREVYRGGCALALTVKEFNLLEYLLVHPRQVLTRTAILDRIWGYDFTGDTNVIEVHIRNLRVKLEQSHKKRLIQTVRGIGYVLRGD
ncbi:response regulator transcription factor [Candidatus Cyanaurora vandensis]|uniref:response regulator transcription factor n=1 Tax=Candidatus Cyanaurora vandensis TaxID=2714958 RepID=UPI00257D4575|nr:response regulator transcription factor [Candidatus Cyanaurora vandensis]